MIDREFVPAFAGFLDLALQGMGDIDDLSGAMLRLHDWFGRHDYHYAMRTPEAWKTFQRIITSLRARGVLDVAEPSYAELAESLRLFYRFLVVLNVATPEVDVVHSTAAGFCGIPCVIARLTRGTPYLLTEHGVYLREQYLNLRRHVTSPFVRTLLYRLMESVVRLNYAAADQVSPCATTTRGGRNGSASRPAASTSSTMVSIPPGSCRPRRASPASPASSASG